MPIVARIGRDDCSHRTTSFWMRTTADRAVFDGRGRHASLRSSSTSGREAGLLDMTTATAISIPPRRGRLGAVEALTRGPFPHSLKRRRVLARRATRGRRHAADGAQPACCCIGSGEEEAPARRTADVTAGQGTTEIRWWPGTAFLRVHGVAAPPRSDCTAFLVRWRLQRNFARKDT